jgi:hypothetical protein
VDQPSEAVWQRYDVDRDRIWDSHCSRLSRNPPDRCFPTPGSSSAAVPRKSEGDVPPHRRRIFCFVRNRAAGGPNDKRRRPCSRKMFRASSVWPRARPTPSRRRRTNRCRAEEFGASGLRGIRLKRTRVRVRRRGSGRKPTPVWADTRARRMLGLVRHATRE